MGVRSDVGSPKPEGALEPPFFLGYTESGAQEEFQVFKHYGQALSYMETPEVKDGAFRLFDSLGRHAQLGVRKWDATAEGWSAPNPQELRRALSAYLARLGYRLDPDQGDTRAFASKVAAILQKVEDQRRPAWVRAIRRVSERLSFRQPSS